VAILMEGEEKKKTWLDYHHEMMEQCDKALG